MDARRAQRRVVSAAPPGTRTSGSLAVSHFWLAAAPTYTVTLYSLRPSLLLALVLASVFASSGAQAFCRSTTSKREAERGECVREGIPIAWSDPTIRYTFNERGFPGLDNATLRGAFERSFRSWEEVTCEGQVIGFELQAERGTTPLEKRPEEESSTVSVIGHLSGEDWPDDEFAFALTSTRYYRSGRIAGFDMWFNGGIGNFTICPDEGCAWDDDSVDLLNVATHEAGHALGLAHSDVPGATMEFQTDRTDTAMRSLEADDRAGLCAAYPPGVAFAGEYVSGTWMPLKHSQGSSCATRSGEEPSSRLPPLALAALALLWRYRRRTTAVRRPRA
jgi:MYXO-CTERM domain-containing protein